MLYELYIEGQKADLTEDIEICLSYTSIDCDKPPVEHGGFSKSITLPATATNNNIFGQLYELSRTILYGGDSAVGAYFDPRKRTNYTLWYNGDIVEKGYIKVDSVIKEKGNTTYSCTLFSDLGDFFYNLMYDRETGEELNLTDLYYGFYDEEDNYIDEDNSPLLYWDKDYIYESWSRLNYEIEPNDRSLYSCITAAPCYSGYYDDFDNNKVLVNYESIPNNTAAKTILDAALNPIGERTGQTTYKGWLVCEATRDLDEWEMRDLRTVNQRPCVKMNVILDAISNPVNNGGYEVIWDDEIKNSAYYRNTYLMLNRLDFDLDEQANNLTALDCSTGNMPCQNTPLSTTTLYDAGVPSITTFNLSGYTNPRLSLNIGALFDFGVQTDYLGTDAKIYTSYHPKAIEFVDRTIKLPYIYGGMAVRVKVKKNGTVVKKSATYLITTPVYGLTVHKFGYGVNNWEEKMKSILGLDSDENLVIKESNIKYNDDVYHKYIWEDALLIDMDIPNEDGLSFELDSAWVWVTSSTYIVGGVAQITDPKKGDRLGNAYYFPLTTARVNLAGTNEDDDKNITGIYDGTINPNIQKTGVTKKVLFGDTESPYKYLVGFTRALGAKYRYDLATKRIYIQARHNYYLPEGHNIDKWIDRDEEVEIQPTLSEYKWYKYGFQTPETYAAMLYKKKNKYEYGEAKVDSGYYFSNDESDCFDDIPYTNGVPYLQSSIYYAVYSGIPSILVSPTLTVTTYKNSGDFESDDIKIKGYGATHTLITMKDSAGDKICAFDDGNEPVDELKNCLLFYNGKKQTVDYYQLSDNIPMMQTLNDNPCFMYVWYGHTAYPSEAASEKTYVCKWITDVPVFSKYLTKNEAYTDSLDFIRPNYTFIGDEAKYQPDICLYDRYWKEYINDLYDPDNKAVILYMFLKEKPDTAMRKFYYFDNTVWLISEITDYSASSDKPTKVKFVKVYDTFNYTELPVEWNTGIYK